MDKKENNFDIKGSLEKSYVFYNKAQLLFFMILFLAIGVLIFLSFLPMIAKTAIIVLFFLVIGFSMYIFFEAKNNKETVKDYIILYKMKEENERNKKEEQ